MKCESEVFKKYLNSWGKSFENFSVFMQKNHIIHIPAIVPDFERVFYEMIKLMEVEISEELTDEVSKWKTAISVRGEETFVLWEIWVDFT